MRKKLPGLIAALFMCAASPVFAGGSQFTPPLTSGSAIVLSSTSLGTAPVQILPRDGSRGFLQFENISVANSMACTLDGSAPVINGNGVQLAALGSATYDSFVPTGALTCIGSASNTAYTVVYLP